MHRTVYEQYPWPKPVNEEDVYSLIESSQNQPFILCHDQQLVVAAVLKAEDNLEVLHLSDFAAYDISSPIIESFIKQLLSKIETSNVKRISTWMWDSEKTLLDALIHVGFVERERQGLFSVNITKLESKIPDSTINIQSLSEGITISDFVNTNREAFKDDSSRPLEEKELEEWLEKSEGFLAECQLAAVLDDRVVGTVMSETFTNSTTGVNHREAWIYGLGVLEQYRRQGIASLLLNALIRCMRDQGVEKIWLFTDTEGPIWSFYNHAGFAKEVDRVELDLTMDR